MHQILREAKNAEAQREELHNTYEAKMEEEIKRRDKICEELYKKIRNHKDTIWKLESKQNDAEFANKEKENELRQKREAAILPLLPAIKKRNDIIAMMEILRDNETAQAFKVLPRQYGRLSEFQPLHLETIQDNNNARLQVWIIENQKPINKYQIVILGTSRFSNHCDNPIVKFTRNYGIGENVQADPADKRYNFYLDTAIIIKEGSSVNELQAWHKARKPEWYNAHLPMTEQRAAEELYAWVIENTNTKEWQLEYLKDQKDYYENNYSRGTETPEYASIIKELKALRGA
jgi:hypothetical protein